MKTAVELTNPASLSNTTTSSLTGRRSVLNNVPRETNDRLALYKQLLQIKRSKKKSDGALRPLFFNIGMTISLLLAITAINWKFYDDRSLMDLGMVESDMGEIIEIPISSQPPPPAIKNDVFIIKEVKDTEIIEDLEVSLDVEVTEEASIEEIEISVPVIEEVVEEIFVIVEQEPLPQGGYKAFYDFLAGELNYPPGALRLGITGTVYVQFIVEKDGSIAQPEVVKGIGAGCDEEALRVIRSAPPWTPGKQRGVPVRVKKIIPMKFMLAND